MPASPKEQASPSPENAAPSRRSPSRRNAAAHPSAARSARRPANTPPAPARPAGFREKSRERHPDSSGPLTNVRSPIPRPGPLKKGTSLSACCPARLIIRPIEIVEKLTRLQNLLHFRAELRQHHLPIRPTHLPMQHDQLPDRRAREVFHVLHVENDLRDVLLLNERGQLLPELLDVVFFGKPIPKHVDSSDVPIESNLEKPRLHRCLQSRLSVNDK